MVAFWHERRSAHGRELTNATVLLVTLSFQSSSTRTDDPKGNLETSRSSGSSAQALGLYRLPVILDAAFLFPTNVEKYSIIEICAANVARARLII